MTDTGLGLLRAICEDRESDAPRLVFADYLDEQAGGDDPRAEFIRCQIELARLDAGGDEPVGDTMRAVDAGWRARDERVDALRRREQALFAAADLSAWFPGAWGAGFVFNLADLAGYSDADPPFCLVRRGFVESVTASLPEFMAFAPALFSAHPITAVRIDDIGPDYTDRGPGFRNFYCWPSLQRSRLNFLHRRGYLPSGHDSWRDTADECMANLSSALVHYGREVAGLPALTER